MDPETATTVLLVLGSAFGVMFATMTTLLVVSIRVQYRESKETREYVVVQIEKAFGDAMATLGDAMGALRLEFNERLDSRFDELMRVIEHNHQISELQHKATQKRLDRLEAGVAETRERLARIEGHLGIGSRQPADPGESDSDAA
ncbi:MAG: hypothetical protein F4Z00_11860 [Acidimicrobiaceae bacterium]|nr:hypothetical protein [Acidimicrobiaceae bacterium]MXZ66224.1 hypothetical protein [Acidimicrobiaceae bacterium]MYF33239.1 hypothetical protein [Acidimicrobiaceae bacterium]MYG77393.1 hypothetical protein [Acidimicrobiaceae bacterium]MYJ29467.1 hypothetical protein [Acidimicrobiaceae bacterium]